MTGIELRTALARAGLSAYALAEKVGVDRNTVYGWLAGRHAMPEPTARLIVRILGEITQKV